MNRMLNENYHEVECSCPKCLALLDQEPQPIQAPMSTTRPEPGKLEIAAMILAQIEAGNTEVNETSMAYALSQADKLIKIHQLTDERQIARKNPYPNAIKTSVCLICESKPEINIKHMPGKGPVIACYCPNGCIKTFGEDDEIARKRWNELCAHTPKRQPTHCQKHDVRTFEGVCVKCLKDLNAEMLELLKHAEPAPDIYVDIQKRSEWRAAQRKILEQAEYSETE